MATRNNATLELCGGKQEKAVAFPAPIGSYEFDETGAQFFFPLKSMGDEEVIKRKGLKLEITRDGVVAECIRWRGNKAREDGRR